MKKIGKFKICGLLGQGGMGKILKIEYPITGKIGALKLLAPNPFLSSLLGKDDIEEMFTAEAVKMANIMHPHVVEVLDFDRFEGQLYYIMDFYSNNLGTMIGESYETEKRSRVISLDKAIYYTRQILSGLSRLHFSSIIHRDIKPYNVLVTDQDEIKICDFGLSKLRKETFKGHKSLKIGSPYYAPPELETNPDNVDFSCDLYSVGIMFYRMLTGRLPGVQDKKASLYNNDLDSHWDNYILKAIHPEPDNRYADARLMQQDLDELSKAWSQKKVKICSNPFDRIDDDENNKKKINLRSLPEKVSKSLASSVFEADDLMKPKYYTQNQFEKKSGDVVHDHATRLIWQISGTQFPVTHFEAKEYITSLNQKKFGGLAKWRLPTVNELLTLVTETPEGDAYCVESIFDNSQKWLWSSDRCTFITAWYISLELGYTAYNDFSSRYHIKAVCTFAELPESADSCVTHPLT